jgi:rare lipoprotein A
MKRVEMKQITAVLILLFLMGCGGNLMEKGDSAPSNPPDVSGVLNAVPKNEKIRSDKLKSYVVLGKRYYPMSTNEGYSEKGIASWYGKKFHGRKTATGEIYNMYQMTAAHKTLPLPSYAEVTNLNNGLKIIVRVNDRGPFHQGRIIDLSYAGATKLDIIGNGTAEVEVKAINTEGYEISNQPIENLVVNAESLKQGLYSKVYLQVGTFDSIGRAEDLKEKLAGLLAETVSMMPFYRGQGVLYRVRIGPLANIEASEVLAEKLRVLGVAESHAVVE